MSASLPYPDKPANGAVPDADPIRLNLLALLGAIQSFDAAQVATKTIVEAAFADNVNPRLRDGAWMAPWIEVGGWTSAFTALSWTMPSGVAWYAGYRSPFTGTTYSVPINQDTYYSVTQAGAIASSSVANNAAVPALPPLSQWLAKVVSGASTITAIVDLRSLGPVSPVVTNNPYKFSAYLSASQTIAAYTWTKATVNAKDFDTSNNFDVVNNRFVAPVNGFYLIAAQIGITDAGSGTGQMQGALYKNGGPIITSTVQAASGSGTSILRAPLSRLVSMTVGDYIEIYGYIGEAGRAISGGSSQTFISGFLVSKS